MERLVARQLVRSWSSQPYLLRLNNHNSPQSVRHFGQKSNTPDTQPKGFLAKVIQNIKSEFASNKEIKESLDKFRRETQKLEETEALNKAREKFRKVEAESIRDVNEVLKSAKDSIKSSVDKAKEAEIIKRTLDTANKAAEGISRQGEALRDSAAYKRVSEASKSVERELNDADILSSLYKAPKTLLKRSEWSGVDMTQRPVKANDDVQSVELHKDSRWSQNWKRFKEENPYVNKVFELKMRLDESENPLIRVTKNFVDRVSDTVGGLFQTTDLSLVMTEICNVDPDFDINNFLKDCEKFIIPTILESMCQNRLDILADWCHEAVFNVLSQPQKEAHKLGYKIHSRILDLQNIELALGKMMEQGPVLVISFQAQQISYVADSKGNVIEGDPDKVVQNTYVMAFCRDQSDFNPKTAWRLIDVAMQQSQFMF